ncbi:hypothetical protein D6764_01310 [Candidatus Woesearchaeota archaeon]|nr:MAG: hypothetical protein D6764_01310 [Candidatus Woesearchaeota archaeon]
MMPFFFITRTAAGAVFLSAALIISAVLFSFHSVPAVAAPLEAKAKVLNAPPSIDFVGTYEPVYAKSKRGKPETSDEFKKLHDMLKLNKKKVLEDLVPEDEFSPSRREMYIGVMVSDLNTCQDIKVVRYQIVKADNKETFPYPRFGRKSREMSLLYCQNLTAFYFARYTMGKRDEYRIDTKKHPGSYRVLITVRDSESYISSSSQREWADFHYGKESFFSEIFNSKKFRERGTTADYLIDRMRRLSPWRNIQSSAARDEETGNPQTEEPSIVPEKKSKGKPETGKTGKKYAQLGSGWAMLLMLPLLLILLFIIRKNKQHERGD